MSDIFMQDMPNPDEPVTSGDEEKTEEATPTEAGSDEA